MNNNRRKEKILKAVEEENLRLFGNIVPRFYSPEINPEKWAKDIGLPVKLVNCYDCEKPRRQDVPTTNGEMAGFDTPEKCEHCGGTVRICTLIAITKDSKDFLNDLFETGMSAAAKHKRHHSSDKNL